MRPSDPNPERNKTLRDDNQNNQKSTIFVYKIQHFAEQRERKTEIYTNNLSKPQLTVKWLGTPLAYKKLNRITNTYMKKWINNLRIQLFHME